VNLSAPQQRALLYLYKDAGRDGVSCFDVGNAVWPDRTNRIASGSGGGDYAAQMLLGRLRKAGLVEHAPSEGSSRWRLSQKGLAAVSKLRDAKSEVRS
jgi:DNA-binding transcriptional regulator PaaX